MGFKEKAPSESFVDGHEFDFVHLRLQALHTLGHTRDHTCFFDPHNGILLSADLDLTPFGRPLVRIPGIGYRPTARFVAAHS